MIGQLEAEALTGLKSAHRAIPEKWEHIEPNDQLERGCDQLRCQLGLVTHETREVQTSSFEGTPRRYTVKGEFFTLLAWGETWEEAVKFAKRKGVTR